MRTSVMIKLNLLVQNLTFKMTVNPLLRPLRCLFFFMHVSWGLVETDQGLEMGACHKELEHKVENLKHM